MSGSFPPTDGQASQRSDGGGPRPSGRSGDRVPPHSLEAEVSVLGAAMLSRNAASDVLELLQPADFYRTAHRVAFEAIGDLMHRGEAVDAVTLLDELASQGRLEEVGGSGAVHDLVDAVPTAANAVHYAKIVREKALLRRLIDAGTSIARLGYDETEDARAALDRAEALMYDVSQTGISSEYARLRDLLNESFERIEKLAENRSEVTGLATGFNDLDRLTAGLQDQNLVIIAARPAMGKSSLALNITQYVTADLREPAIIFSLEMSKIEIVNRLLASEAQIDTRRLQTGRLQDADWRKLGDALGRLSEAPLFIDDTPSITMMEIASKCRRIKQKHGLQLVVVDYLQLMETHKNVDNRVQEVAQLSRGLKMLAKELDIPVVALSQLSRKPENRTDKRPILADLRESGCLTRGTRLIRADTGRPTSFGELLDEGVQDVPVWSMDERHGLVPATLTHAFPSGTKDVFRVRLRSGTLVEASANHPFRALKGWRRLDELGVGDRVASARRLPEPSAPEPMDRDELVLLAHLIGEGTTLARQPVHYTSADEDNLRAVEKAAASRFGIQGRRERDGRSEGTTQLYLPAVERLTHGVRNPVAAWLDDLGVWDRRAPERRIPAQVFGMPDAQVRLFLRHLFATDGCLRVRPPGGGGPRVRLSYATSSPGLAQDLRLLLLRLGIRARIDVVEQPGGEHPDQHHLEISGATQQRRFLEKVGFHGERGNRVPAALELLDGVRPNTNLDTIPRPIWAQVRARRAEVGMTTRQLQAAIGTACCGSTLDESAPSRTRLARIAEVLNDAGLGRLAESDLFWDEIVEIEPIGHQEVFDATVSGTHNFVAEGLLLHNSIEQDADVVGFIYRDELYDEDTPDKGIAELIVAKHRNGPTGTVKLAFLDHLTKFANLARGGTAPPDDGPPPDDAAGF